MRRRLSGQFIVGLLLTAALSSATWAQAPAPAKGPTPADLARQQFYKALPDALERGRNWLSSQQRNDGSFVDPPEGDAIAGLALLDSGLPVKSPVLQKLLDHLMKDASADTNFLALRAELFLRVAPQLTGTVKRTLENQAEKDIATILAAQEGSGWWSRQLHWGPDLDCSYDAFQTLLLCTVLGSKTPEGPLKKAVGVMLSSQNAKGGWSGSTQPKDMSWYDDMRTLCTLTCLAEFSLDPCVCKEGGSKTDEALRNAVLRGFKSIQNRYRDWAKNPKDLRDPWFYRQVYYIGRLLRGVPLDTLGNARVIEDWCQPLLERQSKDGKWSSGRRDEFNETINSSTTETFQTLYLLAQMAKHPLICEMVEADAPPLANRGLFSAVEDLSLKSAFPMRCDRAVLATDYRRYEKTPLLFLEIGDKFKLTEEQKVNLRNYVAQGGTLLAEFHCGKKELVEPAIRELQDVWPGLAPQPILRNHAVWTTDAAIINRPTILGLDDGVRTFAFLVQKNLTCDWALGDNAAGLLAFQTWRNIVNYALEGQLDFTKPVDVAAGDPETPQLGANTNVSIGILELAAHKANASAAPLMPYNSWPEAVALLAKGNFKLLGPKALACTNENLPLCDIAYLVVTPTTSLAEDELAALQAYLKGGGFLFLEARLGDEMADKTARKIADGLGLKIDPGKGSAFVTGKFDKGARGFAVEKCSQRKGGKILQPSDTDLRLLTLDGKPVGVYSPLDQVVSASGIRCWGLRGYGPTEARRLMANLLLSRTVK